MALSPFISSRPVMGDEFINREKEVSYILGRALNGESTIVVGGPKTGKTSLLQKLVDLGSNSEHAIQENLTLKFVYLDSRFVENPDHIWKLLWETASSKKIRDDEKISRIALERELAAVADRNIVICLIIDDFDLLFLNPAFNDPVFFTSLRSLTTRTGALINIFSSQLQAHELNNAGSKLLNVGSPFFNHMIEIELETFGDQSLKEILGKGGDNFFEENARMVYELAGKNIFLFQTVASFIFVARNEDLTDVPERVLGEVSPFFEMIWTQLNDDGKRLIAVLGLSKIGEVLDKGPIEFPELQSSAANLALKRLAKMGFIESASSAEQSNSPKLSSLLFAWWLRDKVLSESQEILKIETFQRVMLLSRETGTINLFVENALKQA